MKEILRVLVINPGSTTTKLAVFDNEEKIFEKKLTHSAQDLAPFTLIYEQYEYRLHQVEGALKEADIALETLDAVVGRGGTIRPVEGGTYQVNDLMAEHLRIGWGGQHASSLGGLLARELAARTGIPAYIVDPVVMDEMNPLARYSGCPEISRVSKDHPLNQKAAARRAAAELGGKYEQFNFLVLHMGGGISVGVHEHGRLIDVNNCLDGDGPFSPERCGGLPIGGLIDLCYSGKYEKTALKRHLIGGGGLVAYLGTTDGLEIDRRIEAGDEKAIEVCQAMAYQIAKEIGAGAAVLKGKVDAIVITGGLARDEYIVGWVKERVSFLAPILLYPGEFEMEALRDGALRVLRGEEQEKIYQ